MTDEMLDLARADAAQADVQNAEFPEGYIEDIPLPDASVDVVMSDRVINLAGALTEDELRAAPTAAGLADIEIRMTHRVHDQAAWAIMRSVGRAEPPPVCCT